MDRKGQQAVSAVLISGILIGMVGSVYFWGVPLVQKSRDSSVLEGVESLMLLIDQKIRVIASAGGRETIRLYDTGLLSFSNGRLTYDVSTDGTVYASGGAVTLGTTKNCDNSKPGAFGKDDATVLCVTSEQLADLKYSNRYVLSYRNLAEGLKTYRIRLTGADATGGSGSSLVIQNSGVSETTEGGRQITTINIAIRIE